MSMVISYQELCPRGDEPPRTGRVPAHACSCGAVYRLTCNAFKRQSIVDSRELTTRLLGSYLNTAEVRQVLTDPAVELADERRHLLHAHPGALQAADRTCSVAARLVPRLGETSLRLALQ